jgi:hypothetical protein
MHHLFSCHHAFGIQTAQTCFHPFCSSKIQRLILQAPVPLQDVCWEPQVVSVLPWADAKQFANIFFDLSFSFNHWYCFQHICFHFKFCCFSFLSGLWSRGKWHSKPFDNDFCAWGWDFYSGFIDFWFWHGSLFSASSFYSLTVWCDVSLFV